MTEVCILARKCRDLFSAKPIIITGRFTGNPSGKITIKGYQGTGDFSPSDSRGLLVGWSRQRGTGKNLGAS